MDNENLQEICGYVAHIIYYNDKNGYAVILLETQDGEITVVGALPFISVGETLNLKGKFKTHPNFGVQFEFSEFEKVIPQTEEAILLYLSSGVIKGVGEKTAKRLVDMFGENTLDIIENYPLEMCKIKGITENRANKISEEFSKIFSMRELLIELSDFGLNANEAVHVFKLWGNDSLLTLRSDPYALYLESDMFDFNRVDAIAKSLNIISDDSCRMRSGIIHVLKHNQSNGHTCLPMDKLAIVSARFLDVGQDKLDKTLKEMVEDGSLKKAMFSGREFIFINDTYECETYVAERIHMMLKFPAQAVDNEENEVKLIESKHGIEYDNLQKKAICDALSKGILVLTGGPGTGKTTTLKAIIDILKSKGNRVYLAAPTGRAAQRMSELTKEEAKTIHRMLEVSFDSNDNAIFNRNERNLLDCDALIIDEISMVDIFLFEAVLKALPLGCRLIMVGDCDQLPCVGAGNVLSDLITSCVLPVVSLKKIFRQAQKSLIVINAHRIVAGQMPVLDDRTSDFFFLPYNNKQNISDVVVDLCVRRLPASYKLMPFDIQILSPSKKGELGTYALNLKLQGVLNPQNNNKKEIKINNLIIREGDKVMQIKNNYDIPYDKDDGTHGNGVFNGDVGVLIEISRDKSNFAVRFEDKTAYYTSETAVDLDLAYAMTVHKSQGSEFEAVIMPMFNGPVKLYYRNLLYTAVTRAKNILIMVGKKDVIFKMVDNDKKTKRFSGLSCFLKGECTYES